MNFWLKTYLIVVIEQFQCLLHGSVFSSQDPVLLTGSVRKNLDPLSDRTDLEIWHALKQVSAAAYAFMKRKVPALL